MKKPFRAILSSIGLVILMMLIQVLGGSILGLYYAIHATINHLTITPESMNSFIMSHINMLIIINALVQLFVIGLLFIIRSVPYKTYIAFHKFSIKHVPILFCIAMSTQLIGIYAMEWLDLIHPLEDSYNEMLNAMQSGNFFASLLAMAILAPIIEEILFRGIIFKKLSNHLSIKWAFFIQAALFGGMHMNMAQLLPTFILGCIAALLYRKYNSIWVPIVYHMLFNTIALISTYTSETIQMLIFYGAYISTAILALYYLPKLYNNQKKQPENAL